MVGTDPHAMETEDRLARVLAEIDAANGSDPGRVAFGGAAWATALIEGQRAHAWTLQLYPEASDALQIATRAHHLRRWEIERAAYDYQKAVEAGTEVVVGVNRYEIEEAAPIPTLRIDPAGEAAQIARLREVRASRNSANAFAAIERVGEAARNGTNLMPPILAAVEAYATIGEIADALRAVFGEYSEVG